jgi:cytochrome c oxidase subunit 2
MRSTVNQLRAAAAIGLGMGSTAALADWALNMPEGVTPISQEAYDLHMLILWICVVIGVGVFGAMLYAILKHRKSLGVEPAQFHHSTAAEIVWTVVPIVILVSMAVPATNALIRMEDTSQAQVTIKVTGYQWKWRYEYLEDDVSFFSTLAYSSRAAILDGSREKPENYLLEVDNNVVIPAGKKVRLLLTADDVLHAWWVPEFGMKKDAIPGFINELWIRVEEPGLYRGQCAELCGRDHGFMPIVVEVKTPEEYAEWVAATRTAKAEERLAAARSWQHEELMAEGEAVYADACAACHQADGSGQQASFPPIAGSNVARGDINEHLQLVMHGKAGTAMRGYASELNDVELAAVMTYQRNAFGNASGDTMQPAHISAAREL